MLWHQIPALHHTNLSHFCWKWGKKLKTLKGPTSLCVCPKPPVNRRPRYRCWLSRHGLWQGCSGSLDVESRIGSHEKITHSDQASWIAEACLPNSFLCSRGSSALAAHDRQVALKEWDVRSLSLFSKRHRSSIVVSEHVKGLCPQILKTRVHLQFWKVCCWRIWLSIDPP